jgi:photosystem II stability/assembly factor-like uncharacterized protein
MSDLTRMVAALRTDTSQVNWPEAAEVRARTDRRTARRRVTGAAIAVVAIAVAAATLTTGGPHRSAPAGPGQTVQRPLDSIAAAPSGTIFAITHACCSATQPQREYSLLRSVDHARTWTTVGPLDGLGSGSEVMLEFVVASDQVLWIGSGAALMGSDDGGRHWNRWNPGADPTQSKGGGLAGTTLWLANRGHILVATDGGQPVPTPAQPPGSGSIASVAAVSSGTALALRDTGDRKGWYRTDDGGTHWTPATNPCAQLPHSSPTEAKMDTGREGGLWATCFVPHGGAPGWQIATSADGGHTWQPHPGDAPGGDDVSPVSATIAWRTGTGADVYRTTDAGAHWTDVAAIPAGSPIQHGFVLNATTALYVLSVTGTDSVTLHLTTDGGATWTTLPFSH